jgi:hypothetical protein
MSLLKIVAISMLLLFCVIYMIITKHYYIYCTYAKISSDYMVEEELKPMYFELCNDVFKDYSKHSLMKYSLEFIYSMFVNINLSEREYTMMKQFINTSSVYSMRIEMKTLKLVHITFYFLVLFIAIVCLPRILVELLFYLIDKVLVIFFVILIVEAVLNLYMDMNLDIMKLIKGLVNYIPINMIGGVLFKIFEYAARMGIGDQI